MELVPDTRAFASYSPTSTPILDVLRPAPRAALVKLTTGEYFFASSVIILAVISLSEIRLVLGYENLKPAGLLIFIALLISGSLLLAAIDARAWSLFGLALGPVPFSPILGNHWEDSRPVDSRLHACGIIHLGAITLAPRHSDNLRKRLLGLILSGPLANLIFAAFVLACPYWSDKRVVSEFVAYVVAIFSVLYGLATLLPDLDRKGNYSDGARLLMLLKNDELAARWLSILQLQMQLGQGIHPRDWDKAMLVRALRSPMMIHVTRLPATGWPISGPSSPRTLLPPLAIWKMRSRLRRRLEVVAGPSFCGSGCVSGMVQGQRG